MKKILTILILFLATLCFAQNSGITYQAVIYGPNGQQLPGANNQQYILANKTICIRFGIIDQNNQIEYQETIVTTTDKFGMVNLLIGTGNQVGGFARGFSNILWDVNTKSLQVELDTSQNCQNFTEISNSPFTYVPFAYYSANNGSSAYQIWLDAGNTGTEAQFLNSLKGAQGNPGEDGENGTDGTNGSSAYQIWLAAGNTGTEAQFLESLKGAKGSPGEDGENGTDGTNGSSAYQIWLAAGNTGTEAQFLESLKGAKGSPGEDGENGTDGTNGSSAYQIWLAAGNTGTEVQFLNSLKGAQGNPGEDGENGTDGTNGSSAYRIWLDAGNTGTETEFLNSLKGAQGNPGEDGANGLDGLGIVSTINNNNGTFTINYTDGSSFTTSDFTGPPGISDGVISNSGNEILHNYEIFNVVGIWTNFIIPLGTSVVEVLLTSSVGGDGGDCKASNGISYQKGGTGGGSGYVSFMLNVQGGEILSFIIGENGQDGADIFNSYQNGIYSNNGESGLPSEVKLNGDLLISLSGGEGGNGARCVGNNYNGTGNNGSIGNIDPLSYQTWFNNGLFNISDKKLINIGKQKIIIRY